MLTLLFALLAHASFVRGQAVEAPASPAPEVEVLPAPDLESHEKKESPSGWTFFGKKLIAEDAEAAEELEAFKRPPRVWARTEFLLWFIKPANLPALVTTGPYSDPRPGALDSLATKLLFGRQNMDYQDRTGGRFTFGTWLDDEQIHGLEAGYFFIRGRSIGQAFTSPGNPVLATPFFNTNTNTQDSSLITFPGVASGSVVVDAPSFLQGAEANLSARLWHNEHFHMEGLLGFRYLNLNEGLNINAVSDVSLAPQYQMSGINYDGKTIDINDAFETRNHFYGGQLGLRTGVTRGRWGLDFLGKVALGVSHQIVTIRGATTVNTQPAFAQDAGLFALSSNSGRYTSNRFAVVPEVGMNLTFQLTERLKLFGGYSILYWNNVARPADQVDPALNPNLIPTSTTYGVAAGPIRPTLNFHHTDFYAHGANFGLEFRY